MSSYLNIADYLVVALMLFVSAAIGLYFRFTGGRQKTTEEFLMGGNNMSIAPVAFSLMATYMSAISILGIPSEVYMYGTQYFFWMLGTPIGAVFAVYGLLPVYCEMKVLSVYEYLEKRFGKTTRTVASLLFCLQTLFYMASVLYAPSLALNAVTGLSTWASVCSLGAICTFYCTLGGLKAVLWTDVFQSILMYVTLLAIAIKGALDMGGTKNILNIADEGGRLQFSNMSLDFTQRYTVWNSILAGTMFSLFAFGSSQSQVQRMLSTGNLKKAQISAIVSAPLICLFCFFCYWDGIVIYSYFRDCDPLQNPTEKINSPDQVFPYAILKIFGSVPGLSGLCIAGIFSASLSSVSSALSSLTALTVEDFIRPFCSCRRLSEPWITFIAKFVAIIYGAACLVLTYVIASFRGVVEGASVMIGLVSGPMFGVFCLGMFTTTSNEMGTLIGLFLSFVFGIWLGFGALAAKVKVPSLPRSIESCTTHLNKSIFLLGNDSSMFDSRSGDATDAPLNKQDRYIFPLYKVSFVWYPIFAFLIAVISGYVASFLIGIWKKNSPIKEKIYSPFVRKFYFGSPKTVIVGQQYFDVELKSNSIPQKNCSA